MLLSSLLKTLSGFFFELLWRDDGLLCCEFVSVSTLSPSPVSDWGCSCFNDRGPRAAFWAIHCVCASVHLCCSPAVLVKKSRLHLVHLYTNPCSTIVLRSPCEPRTLPKNVLTASSILLLLWLGVKCNGFICVGGFPKPEILMPDCVFTQITNRHSY